MKVLVTGFDPFGGEAVNPAYEAVELLPDEIAGAELVKLESRQAGALLPAVHHEVTPEPGPWSSPVRRQPLIRLRKQQYDCRLLLRLPVL